MIGISFVLMRWLLVGSRVVTRKTKPWLEAWKFQLLLHPPILQSREDPSCVCDEASTKIPNNIGFRELLGNYFHIYLKKIRLFFLIWERVRKRLWTGGWAKGEGEEESQADSPLSVDPNSRGYHDPSWIQIRCLTDWANWEPQR